MRYHLDINLYFEIEREHQFLSFGSLPLPCSGVPMSLYEYEYKTYFVTRSNQQNFLP